MSDKAKDWEDRVVLLEKAAADGAAREQAMAKELAEAKARAESLAGVVEQARAADKKRRESEVEAFMADLKAKAQPNAIAEADLAKVKGLFDRGDDENARFVAGLLLKGAAPAQRGTTVQLAPAGNLERQKADTAYVAGQLRAQGWSVELSADGTQITKQTPPAIPARAGR